ncbi:MAG: hypothetical protein DRQ43_01555 [Gammaproteobacteria bacterium]|nr:MAG: hypothetical protein DRQ43_01555 [Gammaproteobacteria bacterium]
MDRKQLAFIKKDLKKKMVFLVGPRQVGKTKLALMLAEETEHLIYLNKVVPSGAITVSSDQLWASDLLSLSTV